MADKAIDLITTADFPAVVVSVNALASRRGALTQLVRVISVPEIVTGSGVRKLASLVASPAQIRVVGIGDVGARSAPRPKIGIQPPKVGQAVQFVLEENL